MGTNLPSETSSARYQLAGLLSVFVWLECTKNKFDGGGAPFWNHPLMHLSLLLAHLSSSLSYSYTASFCHIFSRSYRVSDSSVIMRFKSVALDFVSHSGISLLKIVLNQLYFFWILIFLILIFIINAIAIRFILRV